MPNENIQQEAGQRQDRTSLENAAQFSLQRIFSSNMVGDIRGMVRDVSAKLWSNPESTPIAASQDRGFREFYLNGSISGHRGVHEWKAGADMSAGTVREDFAYTITNDDDFDSDVPLDFTFADRRHDREQALFVQDQIRSGPWTVNAGLRWDHYSLVVEDNAFSPRLAVAWSWPAEDLVFRAVVRSRVSDARDREPAARAAPTSSSGSARRPHGCRCRPRAAISSRRDSPRRLPAARESTWPLSIDA